MEEQNIELVHDFLSNNRREVCVAVLGTTIPTLQRWISKDVFPDYVYIILELRASLKATEQKLDYANFKTTEVKQTVSNFVNASSALKDLISD